MTRFALGAYLRPRGEGDELVGSGDFAAGRQKARHELDGGDLATSSTLG
jgi:hypothetical protein